MPPLTLAPKPDVPSTYEETNVHQVYNLIATHFSATRYKPWPTISTFLSTIPPGSLGLDAGCGNGKYLPSFDRPSSLSSSSSDPTSASPAKGTTGSSIMIGLDRSDNLVALAHRVGFEKEGEEERVVTKEGDGVDGRRREVMVADVLDLGGVRKGSMDFAISIATLHHLSTPERRLSTVITFLRVLTPTHGRGMVHVWALEQDASSKRIVPDLPSSSNDAPDGPSAQQQAAREEGAKTKAQDVFVPWVLSKEAPKSVGEALKGEKKKKERKEQKKGKKALATQQGKVEGGMEGLSIASGGEGEEKRPSPAVAVPPAEEGEPPAVDPSPPTPAKVYQRYYHLFRAGELSSLVEEACRVDGVRFIPYNNADQSSSIPKEGESWLRIVKEGWERDNWFVEIQRGVGPKGFQE